MPSDDKSSHCLWQGELKQKHNTETKRMSNTNKLKTDVNPDACEG
jgi:hypothetical protein